MLQRNVVADEVPEGVGIWSGRWCHRKKAGRVRSRYVVRQYHTEWSEDAFCGTPGWGAIRLLLAVASFMRWKVMPGDFSTAFMHTPLLDSDEYWIEPPRGSCAGHTHRVEAQEGTQWPGDGQQEVPAAFVSTST